jgi:hypothetical protein
MSRRFSLTTKKPQQVVYAEGATLPTISAAGFSARVSAYVIGQSGSCEDGETDLWYLSLVGAHGQEASLRALWANLVSNRPHRGYSSDAPRLTDVGRVALAHARKDLLPAVLGWRIHWNWHMETVAPGRDKHAILEPDLLTCYDPAALRDLPAMTVQELDAVKRRPCFLLLVGREDATGPRGVALRHLRFLSTRVAPLAYYPPLAAYLWERALAEGEVEPLRVWCYDPATTEREASPETEVVREVPERPATIATAAAPSVGGQIVGPVLVGAYLCRPHPEALMRDLRRAIARDLGAVPTPLRDAESADACVDGDVPARIVAANTGEGDAEADATPAARHAPPPAHTVAAPAPPAEASPRNAAAADPDDRRVPPMLAVVRAIVEAAGQTAAFEQADEFCLKIPNPPFEDLVIEAHPLPGRRRMVTVTHYLPQDDPLDDLIADSDVELTWDGTPRSLTVRGPYGPLYTPVPDESSPGRDRVLAEIEEFLRVWAANLTAQGFVAAAARLRHEPEAAT